MAEMTNRELKIAVSEIISHCFRNESNPSITTRCGFEIPSSKSGAGYTYLTKNHADAINKAYSLTVPKTIAATIDSCFRAFGFYEGVPYNDWANFYDFLRKEAARQYRMEKLKTDIF